MNEFLMELMACSLSMAAVTLLGLALMPALEKRCRKSGLYALWLVVLLGFLVPFRPQAAQKPAVTVEVPRAVFQPVAQTRQPAQAQHEKQEPVEMPQSGEEKAAPPQITPIMLLQAVYLIGAAATLAVQGFRHLRFMRTIRRWQRPVTDTRILAAYDEARQAMCVRRAPALMRCAAVEGPMLVGFVHPRILLPGDVQADAALDLVLRHELTHYRRHDLLVRLMMLWAQAIHWFNPAVYAAVRMADYACELSCDERAVRGMGRDARAAYSGAILACLREGKGARSVLTTSFFADKRMLKRRLISMMDMRLKRRGVIFALTAALLIVLLGANFVLAEANKGKKNGPPEADSVVLMTMEEVRAAYAEDTAFTVYAFGSNDGWSMQGTAFAQENGGDVWHAEPTGDWMWEVSDAFGYEEPYPLTAVWVTFPDGRTALAALNANAHGEDVLEENAFDGQMDLCFADNEAAEQTLDEGWIKTRQMAGIAGQWHDQTPMTIEEMQAVYAASTSKMNTIASYRYDEGFLEAYEAEVEATGGTLKGDMVICDLPGEDDMPYDAALEFAYSLIEETYGTPRSELLEMGVYPTFYTYPYLMHESEWEFYITPRRNCDIGLDHMYPAAGEYRVLFTSRTQQVEQCLWYPEVEPEGELRWSEEYSLAKNPVRPEDEMGAVYIVMDQTTQEAQRAFEIVRQDMMAYMEMDEETFDAVFYIKLNGGTTTEAWVSVLVRESAPQAFIGHNYSYTVDLQTGEVINRQVTTGTISTVPREEGSAVLDLLDLDRTQANLDDVQVIGLRRQGEHAQAEMEDALWDGHTLNVGVMLAADQNVYVVVDEANVDGEPLEATSGNIEDVWLYGWPSRVQGGGMSLILSGETEGERPQGSRVPVHIELDLLSPRGEVVMIDTQREDTMAVWQEIDACVAAGNTPVEADEPHRVLVSSACFDGEDVSQGLWVPLGDAQSYIEYANMERLETFDFTFDMIAK